MEKSREKLQQLIQGYFDQTITVDENNELWEYVQDPTYLEDLETLLPDVFEVSNTESGLDENRKQTILQYIFSYNRSAGAGSRTVKLWPRIAVTAAAITAIVFGVYFFANYLNGRHPDTGQAPATAQYNNIKPGTQGATLTLANGRKIKLSDATNGELAKEAEISITKTADGQIIYNVSPSLRGGTTKPSYNTLTTAKGETYMVTLPDKSKVWLNAASSLTYTSALNDHGQRRVKLSGEAYFEITKDKAHPFMVESRGQEVEVLGTHFNISNYADETSAKTTLLEGSVKVSSLGGGTAQQSSLQTITLKPGQQSLLTPNNQITVTNVNAEDAIAWKDGLFIFNDEPLESIMNKIARWYNVDIIYQDVNKTRLFGGGVSRFENISKVLEKLELTGLVHFKIEGRRVFVTK